MAATFVVLGTQGVILYDRIRRLAHGPTLPRDDFHDGYTVLPVVTEWHKYLEHSVRLTDAFTARVLEMVNNHMLVVPPEARWDARQVNERLSSLIHSPEINALDVPESIEEMLGKIDFFVSIANESSINANRVDSGPARKHMLSNHGRNDSLGVIEARFKSEAALLNTQIMPTAQRSIHRPALIERFGAEKSPQELATLISSPTRYAHAKMTQMTRSPIDQVHGFTSSKPFEYPPITEEPEDIEEQPVTMWQVLQELEAKGKGRSLSSLRTFRDRRVSVKGKIPSDPLSGVYDNRDIVS